MEIEGARLKTDASGQCVFNLRPGAYNYRVKKTGYISASGTVTITSSNVTQAVTLASAS